MKFSRLYALSDLFPQATCEPYVSLAGITSPDKNCQDSLVVFFKAPTQEQMKATLKAAAWIVPINTTPIDDHPPCYFVEKPRYELLLILRRYLEQAYPSKMSEVDLTAIVHPEAYIAHGASIGPYAVIGEGVVIGPNCVVGPHCVIDERAVLEEDITLHAHVHLYSDVQIGSQTKIYSHSVVGMPGFGFEFIEGEWQHLPHCGGVEVGQRCVIGSHVSIAAGLIEPTIIGDDVILDNHIHIAHQVEIKQGNAIAACVGVAGSTTIEPYCQIGGGTMISGHLTIGPQVQITGMSMVNKSLLEPGRYSSGWPIDDNSSWRRKVASLNRLPQYIKNARHKASHDE